MNPGFQPDGAMAIRVTFQGELYKGGDQIRNRVNELDDRLRGLPGVTAVAAGTVLPLGGLGALNDFAVEGAPPPPPDVNQEIAVAGVTPDYFSAIGTPLQRGRLFTALDHEKAPPVGADQRGRGPPLVPRTRIRSAGACSRAADRVKWSASSATSCSAIRASPPCRRCSCPTRSAPADRCASSCARKATRWRSRRRFAIRFAPSIRTCRIADVVPLGEMVSRSIARPRFYTSLLTLFAAVALALSATGIFGVMSYTVAQQSKEIGIRMALGARTADVLRSIVGRALALAGIGVVAGVIAALALGRLIRNQLFGVNVFDPLTLTAVIAVLLASAALASLLPARRAATVDPMTAFRT